MPLQKWLISLLSDSDTLQSICEFCFIQYGLRGLPRCPKDVLKKGDIISTAKKSNCLWWQLFIGKSRKLYAIKEYHYTFDMCVFNSGCAPIWQLFKLCKFKLNLKLLKLFKFVFDKRITITLHWCATLNGKPSRE